jgi:hypothetical protein
MPTALNGALVVIALLGQADQCTILVQRQPQLRATGGHNLLSDAALMCLACPVFVQDLMSQIFIKGGDEIPALDLGSSELWGRVR